MSHYAAYFLPAQLFVSLRLFHVQTPPLRCLVRVTGVKGSAERRMKRVTNFMAACLLESADVPSRNKGLLAGVDFRFLSVGFEPVSVCVCLCVCVCVCVFAGSLCVGLFDSDYLREAQ